MQKPENDLEAVRIITAALEDFNDTDRKRILRWSQEKLGMIGVIREDTTDQGSGKS